MYFISDIKKMLSSRIVQITFIFLLVTMLADPISVLIHARRYTGFFENIGANPFQFWLLMNSASWGNKVYNILFWVIPVLATGMIYYNEQSSSMSKFLVVRKSKLRYMLSKVISVFSFTFVFCMFLLSLNLLLTFLIFDVRAPFTEQYQRLVPNAGTFGYTLYQISALGGMCQANGMRLQHVKPHGALYNMAAKDYALSLAICEAIRDYDPEIIVMGLSGSEMIRAAKDCGLKAASEVFADRGYEEDGTLVNRRKEGAMITDEDEAIARVIRMIKEGVVTAVTGKDIPIQADSVCVHGDGEKALLFVEKIRKVLTENDVQICPLADIIG